MTVANSILQDPLQALHRAFMQTHPEAAARRLEGLPPRDAAAILDGQPPDVTQPVWRQWVPGGEDAVFAYLPDPAAATFLAAMDAGPAGALLGRLEPARRERLLAALPAGLSKEMGELMAYPADAVGSVMSGLFLAVPGHATVADALRRMRRRRFDEAPHVFVVDDGRRLSGEVPLERLMLARRATSLEGLAVPVAATVTDLAPVAEAMELFEKTGAEALPVVDVDMHLLGVLHATDLLTNLKQDIAGDMQTMVGVSREERALSSTWTAVRKRLPWLHINLLTAFLAAAVVGLFESTIAQFTALAVLLPVVAGQSGNGGAQALAVTMRGLTLREITVRHWYRMAAKEFAAGFLNGLAIAVTCSVGVFLWSRSAGLSLVIGMAMVISMAMAGLSGALVPIILRRLGQDPAQSSSIILTTVTDVAGFMSFLGIATLLKGMLAAG